MIISKTPFRVSLFGGSTDYESYYSKYESLLVGFTIDKYCYTMVRKTPKILGYKTRVSYSKVEVVNDNSIIEHNGVRGVLDFLNIKYGVNIDTAGDFEVKPLPVSSEFIEDFFSRCVLIYMGKTRKSYKIAKSNDCNNKYKENIQKIAHKGYKSFLEQDIDSIAALLDQSWEEKKRVSDLVSSDEIDIRYNELKQNGVIGGKLLGSGGSGFMFGVLNDKVNKPDFKKKYRSNFLDFNLSLKGSEIING
jgi:galactokinase/mevalonate kinase-like predicted kinase